MKPDDAPAATPTPDGSSQRVQVSLLGLLLVVPAAIQIFGASNHLCQTDAVYVRHFIIGLVLLLVLLSFVLASLYQRGGASRILCFLLLAGYCAANGWHTLAFFQHGRGRYVELARFLGEHTKGPVVTVGGDQDFRIGTLVEFYGAECIRNKIIKYYPDKAWPRGGPEWYVSQKESLEKTLPPGEQYTDEAGNTYELVKIFPSAPLSELHLFVCHNTAK